MELSIFLPHDFKNYSSVEKVTAESEEGSFTLLPRHIDFTSALIPGIISYRLGGEETDRYIGCDRGILVKRGSEVLISTARAVFDRNLGTIESTIRNEYEIMDENERKLNEMVASLEIDIARKIFEAGKEYEPR